MHAVILNVIFTINYVDSERFKCHKIIRSETLTEVTLAYEILAVK